MRDPASKKVIGAVGISGDLSESDEACAIAGIRASGLVAQAESAARFALRHNGQNRLLGATRALAATITALYAERAERAERDKL